MIRDAVHDIGGVFIEPNPHVEKSFMKGIKAEASPARQRRDWRLQKQPAPTLASRP